MHTVPCPICQSKDTFVYLSGIYDAEKTDVMECRNCGVQFLNPRMSIREENEYYRNYYLSQVPRYASEALASLENVQSKVYRYYRENKKNYSFIRNTDSVLEIGSGSGPFLKFLHKDLSCSKVHAVEKSEANLQFLRKNFIDYSFYEDVEEVKKLRFDLIVGFMVFEHLRDPETFLREMGSLLHDSGRILLEIPNKREPLFLFYHNEGYRKFYYQKQHYFVHCEKSLEVLAKKTGLTVDAFYYAQNYGLDNHLSWAFYNRKRDYSDITQLLSHKSMKEYKKLLMDKKTTDTLGVIFKKGSS